MPNKPIKTELPADPSNPLRGLKEVSGPGKGMPPVHLWNPPFCGNIPMRIAADGTWYYMGSPIGRKPLVKLFSSILRRDPDGKFYLVTPVEKCGVEVDDAPLIAIRMTVNGEGRNKVISLVTQVDDEVTVDEQHPLRFEREKGTGGLKPYVLVRGGLEALVNRPIFYDLVAQGGVWKLDGADWFGVWSSGKFWPMQRADEIEP
jgi:hypothetical protein